MFLTRKVIFALLVALTLFAGSMRCQGAPEDIDKGSPNEHPTGDEHEEQEEHEDEGEGSEEYYDESSEGPPEHQEGKAAEDITSAPDAPHHQHHHHHHHHEQSPVVAPSEAPPSPKVEEEVPAPRSISGKAAPVKSFLPCTKDSDCYPTHGSTATCKDMECECPEDSEFRPDMGCVQNSYKAVPGQMCSKDKDCDRKDSVCVEGRCQCKQDYIVNADRSKCIPLAKKVGDRCEEEVQCTTLLNRTVECKNDKCACREGTQLKDGKCVEAKGLDGFCETTAVCLVEHSECIQGVCACGPGYVIAADSDHCLEVAQGYKDRCKEDIQCTERFGNFGTCKKNECVCVGGYHFSDMRCWQDQGLMDSCQVTAQCYIPEDGNKQRLECSKKGECVCQEGYEADLEAMRCDGTVAVISGLLLVLGAALNLA